MKSRISVLICDDSALMRKLLKKIIQADPGLNVCGVARNGEDAVIKAKELHPDVITMDINMPQMDGISALQLIMEDKIAPVIMVSSLTQKSAVITFEALELGAFDFVAKPDGTVSGNIEVLADEIVKKIKAAARTNVLSKLDRKSLKVSTRTKHEKSCKSDMKTVTAGGKAVAIGISTGGPKTIFDVLPFLPANLNASVFLVQHMPGTFTPSFAKRIDENSKMKCVEVQAGMLVEPGVIYLARGGSHLKLVKRPNGDVLIRTPATPESLFVPSVGVMMESVLSVYGSNTVGVLMTGMGNDGAHAMVKIKEAGGTTIAESKESSVVFGMPSEAIRLGGADYIAPSWEIADLIVKLIN